ncbi:hypothetical protein KQI74_12390 [Paenibacillus barcinonensis]|uniref:hypothetical protein n=1 Tax=Paenibacillus barcinonensis TaxID=198119 RepID=UPI001C10B35B|nr:hypothetical protein [Paenibacillus barcinonensis]MBU5353091.1 hypothetical protein [Paenibacillus barcinonensis]
MQNIMKINKKILVLLLLPLLFLIGVNSSYAANAGDAGYREGGWLTFGNNHAGLYYGTTGGTTEYVYEIQGYPAPYVQLSTLDTFKDNKTFYGWFTNPNIYASKRDQIMSTAAALKNNPDIGYTAFAQLTYDDSSSSGYISPAYVGNIRCDGVVEYSYEYNDLWVWGKADPNNSSGTPKDFDISQKANVKAHSNLGYDDPWFEVSPRVQRGAADVSNPTKWTQLRPRTS